MNNTNFYISKANSTQREDILGGTRISEHDNTLVYVAFNDADEVVGRIIIIEREVPEYIKGKYWYIFNISVLPEYRRKGLGTELVNEVKKQAELSDIIYMYGSTNATAMSAMFWHAQGFTLQSYAKRQDDPSKPLKYGNYHHLFSYCVRRKALVQGQCSLSVREASKDEITYLIGEYSPNEKKKEFLLKKADKLFGFVAVEQDEIRGVILAFPDRMEAPFDSTKWCIVLFVEPQYRRKGVGRSLVYRMYQYAHGKDVVQLNNIASDGENIGFWYELGFDIFFWIGNNATSAMLRVD